MNQTQKRLQIIKLAISIGDTETIQLQMLKLAPLKTDEKIQEILRGLQAENYAQTQALITEYIETPTEEILQRTSQHEVLTPEEEESIIEEFDLFRVPPEEEESEVEEILDLTPFTQEEERSSKTDDQSVDFEALLNLKSDDILANNIQIDEMTLPKDDFFDIEESSHYQFDETIQKDDFFEEMPTPIPPTPERSPHTKEEITSPVSNIEPSISEASPSIQTSTLHPRSETNEVSDAPEYEPIPYIDQKYQNLKEEFPPIEESTTLHPSAKAWLLKIRKLGYSESEIEEMMVYIRKKMQGEKKAEAAQLLLISAATHSLFAKFMLARSLFKGDLLQKNTQEAFNLFHELAIQEEYPEAICDLAQLYEHGIGVEKDMKEAEKLYKKAMEEGVQRAIPHFERVRKANSGLLGKLFKR